MSVAWNATNWVQRLSGSGLPWGSRRMLPFSSHWSRGSKKKAETFWALVKGFLIQVTIIRNHIVYCRSLLW